MGIRTIEPLDDEEWDRLMKEMEKGQTPEEAAWLDAALKAKMPPTVKFDEHYFNQSKK